MASTRAGRRGWPRVWPTISRSNCSRPIGRAGRGSSTCSNRSADRARRLVMTRRDISIPTADRTMDASVHTPDTKDSDGPWPAVIMFPDAGGVRPTFQEMAQRLADLGYAVLLPNPFYRLGPFEPFDMMTVFGDPDERARLMTLVGSVTKENATRDTEAMLAFLAEQPDVAGDKVGTTGYC